jgi:hypothetical protein
MVTHGMDVYTMFPEEATLVYGEIYGFIRHPLYLSLTCGCISLALFRNNAIALLTALLQLIPALVAGYWEDRELIARVGDRHREYIQRTAALIPLNRLGGFLKLVFFLVVVGVCIVFICLFMEISSMSQYFLRLKERRVR